MNAEALPTTESDQDQAAVIKVFGVGGGGCNALQQIISADIPGVTFKCINTDTQALARFPSESILKLGANLTRGLGAGADPGPDRWWLFDLPVLPAEGRAGFLQRHQLLQLQHCHVVFDEARFQSECEVL